ncbi:AAA family ATPase [Rhizobium ruizarguesonis]|uniref:AAA family ATPase n=1 Tax=Rhizobium ruizarguesonis TaxID=2081791 RepID=UPI0010315853|nr:DUF3696 domain-containing protein [Rhizobium ruizarguesonis]TBD84814.1 DUF3696 domain-containing protein [Rhizobium ruizarguesonis]
MITEVEIKGLKRFEEQRFQFSSLTILAGLNGSGKTSLVQALLLAAEASRSTVGSVRLNGPFGFELGTADDILNWKSSFPIQIRLAFSGGAAEWRYWANKSDQLHLNFSQEGPLPIPFEDVPRSFTYLSAERLGPRSSAISSSLPDDELEIGVRGEFCAQVMSILGDAPSMYPVRQHPLSTDKEPRLLKYEVEQWLTEIVRPIKILAERLGNSSIYELKFSCEEASWVAAPNMGFGASYALPIILAGLTSRAGGLLIVENPEAHLHPAGQSRMGVFLGWLAGIGVQVVLETHSDHVLNGVRRAVAEHRYLEARDAAVNFFDVKGNVENLRFSEAGSISHWPRGFFDQFQIDISALGRIRRTRG